MSLRCLAFLVTIASAASKQRSGLEDGSWGDYDNGAHTQHVDGSSPELMHESTTQLEAPSISTSKQKGPVDLDSSLELPPSQFLPRPQTNKTNLAMSMTQIEEKKGQKSSPELMHESTTQIEAPSMTTSKQKRPVDLDSSSELPHLRSSPELVHEPELAQIEAPSISTSKQKRPIDLDSSSELPPSQFLPPPQTNKTNLAMSMAQIEEKKVQKQRVGSGGSASSESVSESEFPWFSQSNETNLAMREKQEKQDSLDAKFAAFEGHSEQVSAAIMNAKRLIQLVSGSFDTRLQMAKDPEMPAVLDALLKELKPDHAMYYQFTHHPAMQGLLQIAENTKFVEEMKKMKAQAKLKQEEKDKREGSFWNLRGKRYDSREHKLLQEHRRSHTNLLRQYGWRAPQDIHPALLVFVVAAMVSTVVFAVILLKNKSTKENNFYKAFMSRWNVSISTSSSDITSGSSDGRSGSTGTDLRSRMARFEEKLALHKQKMEAEKEKAKALLDATTGRLVDFQSRAKDVPSISKDPCDQV